MAVTKVTRTFFGESCVSDENGTRLTDTWFVHAQAGDSLALALTAVDPGDPLMAVPQHGEVHRDDPTLFVVRRTPSRPNERAALMQVAVEYSSKPEDEAKPEGGGVWNKKVSLTGDSRMLRTNRNRNGLPVKNTFGDVYNADFEVEQYDELITLSFDTDDEDVVNGIAPCRGRVNDAPVTIDVTRHGVRFLRVCPAGTLKCGNATVDVDVGPAGDGRWHVTIPLVRRYQYNAAGTDVGWKYLIPDRGYRAKPATGTGSVPYESGVDLDGSGKKLAEGSLQVLLQEDMVDEADFSPMMEWD